VDEGGKYPRYGVEKIHRLVEEMAALLAKASEGSARRKRGPAARLFRPVGDGKRQATSPPCQGAMDEGRR